MFACDAAAPAPSPLFLAKAPYTSLGRRKRQGRDREKDARASEDGRCMAVWLVGWLLMLGTALFANACVWVWVWCGTGNVASN